MLACFAGRRIAKNDFLLTSGSVYDLWGVRAARLLRVYAVTAEGREHTSWFVQGNGFLTEYDSF